MRYNWHITFCVSLRWATVIWQMHTLWNNNHNHNKITQHLSITSHNYNFFPVIKTFKIYSVSSFQIYNTVMLTVVTLLYNASQEFLNLITGSYETYNWKFYFLTTFTHFPHLLPLPLVAKKHQFVLLFLRDLFFQIPQQVRLHSFWLLSLGPCSERIRGTFGMRGSEAGRVGRSSLGFPLVGWEYTVDKIQGVGNH